MRVYVAIAQTAAGTTELVAAPSAYLQIRVLQYTLIMDDPGGTFAFQDGTDWHSGDMQIGNGGASALGSIHVPLMMMEKGRPLQLTTTGAPANGHLVAVIA